MMNDDVMYIVRNLGVPSYPLTPNKKNDNYCWEWTHSHVYTNRV